MASVLLISGGALIISMMPLPHYLFLIVKAPPAKAPHFDTPFSDKQVHEGESVCFTCTISANPEPMVAWYKDGKDVDTSICKTSQDRNKYSLRINEVFEEDEGLYECRAENPGGDCVCSATLKVLGKNLFYMCYKQQT